MTSWKISNWTPISKNTLIGSFALVIGPIVISDMMLHQKDGRRWVNFPAREYQANGERRFANIIRIPDDQAYRRFQGWCLVELDKIIPADSEKPKPVSEARDSIPF